MLDPFAGVGTIPFEARLQGHQAYGFDISPAAVAVSKAKLEPVIVSQVETCLAELASRVSATRPKSSEMELLRGVRFNGPLENYFHPQTLEEILVARAFFRDRELNGSEALVLASLLHILHGNRPYALSRRSHPITPFAPSGPWEYRGLVARLHEVIERRLLTAPPAAVTAGRMYVQDATETWPHEVCDLDAIITSPPFFDSTRFYSANWMRLWFAGWDAQDFAEESAKFVDERQKKSFSVYDSVFAQASERLNAGGYLAIHLGKSRKCDMAALLVDIGRRHLQLVDSFPDGGQKTKEA